MNTRSHKRKSENRKNKNNNFLTQASHGVTKKFPPRTEDQKQKVSDLVYEYLAQIANVHNRRKQRNNARSNFHRAHLRRHPRNIYPKRKKKRYTKPKSNFDYNLTNYFPFAFEHEATNSQFYRPPILKNVVQNYAKAINEGRNMARFYVYKALSFGVNSGFLVPADDKGQMLRVSSNLCLLREGENMGKNKSEKKIKSKSTNCTTKIKTKRLSRLKNGKSLSKYAKDKRLRKTNKQ